MIEDSDKDIYWDALINSAFIHSYTLRDDEGVILARGRGIGVEGITFRIDVSGMVTHIHDEDSDEIWRVPNFQVTSSQTVKYTGRAYGT